MNKSVFVAFGDKKLERSFELLKKGTFQDRQLYSLLEKVIASLKNNPLIGIKIPQRLWPKQYIRRNAITNLWKCNLPKGWRLIYTIKEDEVMIVAIILEWFGHKEYERKFGY